jgi:hypothetical protein
MIGIHLERAAQSRDRRLVVAKSVLRVADARDCFSGVGRLLRGDLEELLRLFDQAFAEKRAPDLEHQLDVVLVAQLERMAKALERVVLLAELEKGLA